MKITLKNIGKFATEFLHVLERENINSSRVLEERVQKGKQEFMINVQESLVIMLRPSQGGTLACTMSYTVQGVGIPIELRINKKLDYTKFIIKSIKIIPEYSSFATDEFGNIVQDTSWQGSELSKSIEHLRKLESYGRNEMDERTIMIPGSDEVMAMFAEQETFYRGKWQNVKITKVGEDENTPLNVRKSLVGLVIPTIFDKEEIEAQTGAKFPIPKGSRLAYSPDVIEILKSSGKHEAAKQLREIVPNPLNMYIIEKEIYEFV